MTNKNKIFIKKDFKLQEKNWSRDIGFDAKAIKDPEVKGTKYIDGLYSSIEYIEYDTGICLDTIQRNADTDIFTLVFPRSSISKKNLILANSIGLIDPEWRDSIKCRFKYLPQPEDFVFIENKCYIRLDMQKIYKVGDKICQLVFLKNQNIDIQYVEQLVETGRGGFGSTGE
jgi:dUTPase